MMRVTMRVQTNIGNNTQMQILLHCLHVYLLKTATVVTNKKIKKTLDTIAFVCYSVTIINNNAYGGQLCKTHVTHY